MQFRLVTLFLWTTALALFCGAVFALPMAISGVVLLTTMLISPAVWIAGASYADGGRQAFFRGGLIAGILPYAVANLILFLAVLQAFEGGEIHLMLPFFDMQVQVDQMQSQRLSFAVIWLIPGCCAILGGSFSYLTYRLVAPPPATSSRPTEYRVISGRVTVSSPALAERATLREESR
jgi:hypothetical protein